MTVTEQADSWQRSLESRGIDIEETDSPGDSTDPWFETLTRFTRRGFLRVILSPRSDASSVAIHAQLAVPGAADQYAQTLVHHLNSVGESSWETTLDDRPWVFEVKALPRESLGATFDAFEQVADHIGRVEAGADPAELATDFETSTSSGSAGAADEAPSTDPQARDESSSSNAPLTATADSGDAGVFESIGDSASPPSSSGRRADPSESAASRASSAGLESFHLRVEHQMVRAELTLANPLGEHAQKRLLAALEHTLKARFDIKLLARNLDNTGDPPSVTLAIEPAGLGAVDDTSLGDLAGNLGQYFERLASFDDLGFSLLDVLVPALDPDRPPPAADDDRHGGRERISDRRRASSGVGGRPEDSRADSDSGGIVFSFGSDTDTGSDVIEAGDYSDARVRREDATTALVDVVLRHPGYSDKSMRQVLSILLDVDYFEAGKLAEQAPCIIAWGISQERAREFKRVLEGAGGKVTLVEPDSLSS